MAGLLVIRHDVCRLYGGRCFDGAYDDLQLVLNDFCAIPRHADVGGVNLMIGR